MNRSLIALAVALSSTAALAEPVTYQIDPTHTDVIATWNHLGFSKPSAHFGNVEGNIRYDADSVENSTVEVTIPLSALNSFTPKFNDHLHSADFFDSATFPVAKFKSSSVQSDGDGKLIVVGELTIKEHSKPVTLQVTLNKAGEHPMKKLPALGFNASATLLRSDFGLGLYAPNVSDEVQLSITTEALVPAAAQ